MIKKTSKAGKLVTQAVAAAALVAAGAPLSSALRGSRSGSSGAHDSVTLCTSTGRPGRHASAALMLFGGQRALFFASASSTQAGA